MKWQDGCGLAEEQENKVKHMEKTKPKAGKKENMEQMCSEICDQEKKSGRKIKD